MRFYPPSPGFAPAPGSGHIEQGFPRGPGVRRRTIQHQHARRAWYQGTYFNTHPGTTPASWNRRHLYRIMKYWATALTNTDRANWDGYADPGLDGKHMYSRWNKVAGPCVGDSDDWFTTINTIPYPLAPLSKTPPPDPATESIELTAATLSHPDIARVALTGITLPMNYRMYVSHFRPLLRSRRIPPRFALASGPITYAQAHTFEMGSIKLNWYNPIGIAQPMNVLFNVDLDFTSLPTGTTAVNIRTTSKFIQTQCTLTPLAPFSSLDAWEIVANLATPGYYTVAWYLTIDTTYTPNNFAPPLGGALNTDTNNTYFSNVLVACPNGQSFYPTPPSGSGANHKLFGIQQTDFALPFEINFQPAFARIYGPLLPGRTLDTSFVQIDPTDGTPGTDFPLTGTVG